MIDQSLSIVGSYIGRGSVVHVFFLKPAEVAGVLICSGGETPVLLGTTSV